MRFKIDEHLPVEITELLDQHQHDAVTVADESMSGAVDPDVAHVCQKEARALITLDLDFSDIRAYPPEEYQGIIVFRPRRGKGDRLLFRSVPCSSRSRAILATTAGS
jgi:predicted nuclease of predicted toxin-antitoxin system